MARHQLTKAIKRLDSISEMDRDTTIHEIRKSIKKVRALIRMVRGQVGRKTIARANHELRGVARPLSEVRDASVLIKTLDDLATRSQDLGTTPDFTEIRSELVAYCDYLTRNPLEPRKVSRLKKRLDSTLRRLDSWDLAEQENFKIKALKRSYRQGRDAFHEASDDPSAEPLHQLRKRVKTLGFQLRTIEANPSDPVDRLQKLTSLLGDELGEVHDLDILREFLANHDESSPIFGLLDRRRLTLQDSAMLHAGVVFQNRPRDFARILRTTSCPAELAALED